MFMEERKPKCAGMSRVKTNAVWLERMQIKPQMQDK